MMIEGGRNRFGINGVEPSDCTTRE